jgi:hypothetical protein
MFTEEFVADRGFRLARGKISVLLHGLSFGRKLTGAQTMALARAIDEYNEGVKVLGENENCAEETGDGSGDPFASLIRSLATPEVPLTMADFGEVKNGPFFKYVNEEVWTSLRRGCFWFNTAGYYRSTPNIAIQDRHEGYGHFHLTSGNDQLNVTASSGYNCTILCGTSAVDGGIEQLMRSRFGAKRIVINDVRGFAECVAARIGATRARVHDVVYHDVLNFAGELPGVDHLFEITGRDNLTREALHRVNERFFNVFYEYGMLPALFTKPLRYADERERRIVFDMPQDLNELVKIEDRSFLEYVSFHE